MKKLSDADALNMIEKVLDSAKDGNIYHIKLSAMAGLYFIPSVNAEYKRARWFKDEQEGYLGYIEYNACSCCGLRTLKPRTKYCPECGAKMENYEDE